MESLTNLGTLTTLVEPPPDGVVCPLHLSGDGAASTDLAVDPGKFASLLLVQKCQQAKSAVGIHLS